MSLLIGLITGLISIVLAVAILEYLVSKGKSDCTGFGGHSSGFLDSPMASGCLPGCISSVEVQVSGRSFWAIR